MSEAKLTWAASKRRESARADQTGFGMDVVAHFWGPCLTMHYRASPGIGATARWLWRYRAFAGQLGLAASLRSFNPLH
jgi:hypothetical protein